MHIAAQLSVICSQNWHMYSTDQPQLKWHTCGPHMRGNLLHTSVLHISICVPISQIPRKLGTYVQHVCDLKWPHWVLVQALSTHYSINIDSNIISICTILSTIASFILMLVLLYLFAIIMPLVSPLTYYVKNTTIAVCGNYHITGEWYIWRFAIKC